MRYHGVWSLWELELGYREYADANDGLRLWGNPEMWVRRAFLVPALWVLPLPATHTATK